MAGENGRSRVLLVLPDGFDYRLAHRYLDSMPHVRRMMAEGYCGQILPFVSTWGNIDFMSLVTGAAPGTQYRRKRQAGMPEGSVPGCAAETLWEVLGSEGRRSALIDFAQTWSAGTEEALVVAPPGGGKGPRAALFGGRVYQTPDVETGCYDLGLVDRSGWPPGGGPYPNRAVARLGVPVERGGRLETVLALADGVEWRAVVMGDSVELYRPGESGSAVKLRSGAWSEWAEGTIDGERFAVRFRLLRLMEEGRSLAVLASSGCPLDRLADPAEAGRKLIEKFGPYPHGTAIPPRPEDPDYRVGMEELVAAGDWVAEATGWAMREWGAELCVHKNYIVDSANHQCAAMVDPGEREQVQQRIVEALLDWRTPDRTGRVVCFALKKRDAALLGYWGEECGDVLFAYEQGCTWGVNPDSAATAPSTGLTTNHGAGVPTQDTGVTSNMGMLLAWGAKVAVGVKRDLEDHGPIPIHTVGTTLSEILGCRRPLHATGGIVGEMLADGR